MQKLPKQWKAKPIDRDTISCIVVQRKIQNAKKKLIHMLKSRQVDGLIIAPTKLDNTEILQLKKEQYPFVLIDRHFPKINTNYVITDNRGGMYQAVSFLINKNYKRIAFIGVQNYLEVIKQRFSGYKEALKDAKIRFANSLVKEIDYFNLEADMEAKFTELFKGPNQADAFVFATNFVATSALGVLKKMGKKIPDDIAVASFDERELFALFDPGITAVAQPTQRIGEEALNILLEEINNPDQSKEKKKVILKPEFIIRDSQ